MLIVFANLCGCFANFAVMPLFYRKERQGDAKDREGNGVWAQTSVPTPSLATTFTCLQIDVMLARIQKPQTNFSGQFKL